MTRKHLSVAITSEFRDFITSLLLISGAVAVREVKGRRRVSERSTLRIPSVSSPAPKVDFIGALEKTRLRILIIAILNVFSRKPYSRAINGFL